jgi:hypothetical protein
MTDQSIEDASIIEDAKAAGFEVYEHNGQLQVFVEGNCITRTIEKFAQLREARQSSQSEPVAYRWGNENAWLLTDEKPVSNDPNIFVQPLFLAAPQQAIPSGLKLVPIEPTHEMVMSARKADFGPLGQLGQATIRTCYKAMLSASPTSPTSPIERDK